MHLVDGVARAENTLSLSADHLNPHTNATPNEEFTATSSVAVSTGQDRNSTMGVGEKEYGSSGESWTWLQSLPRLLSRYPSGCLASDGSKIGGFFQETDPSPSQWACCRQAVRQEAWRPPGTFCRPAFGDCFSQGSSKFGSSNNFSYL